MNNSENFWHSQPKILISIMERLDKQSSTTLPVEFLEPLRVLLRYIFSKPNFNRDILPSFNEFLGWYMGRTIPDPDRLLLLIEYFSEIAIHRKEYKKVIIPWHQTTLKHISPINAVHQNKLQGTKLEGYENLFDYYSFPYLEDTIRIAKNLPSKAKLAFWEMNSFIACRILEAPSEGFTDREITSYLYEKDFRGAGEALFLPHQEKEKEKYSKPREYLDLKDYPEKEKLVQKKRYNGKTITALFSRFQRIDSEEKLVGEKLHQIRALLREILTLSKTLRIQLEKDTLEIFLQWYHGEITPEEIVVNVNRDFDFGSPFSYEISLLNQSLSLPENSDYHIDKENMISYLENLTDEPTESASLISLDRKTIEEYIPRIIQSKIKNLTDYLKEYLPTLYKNKKLLEKLKRIDCQDREVSPYLLIFRQFIKKSYEKNYPLPFEIKYAHKQTLFDWYKGNHILSPYKMKDIISHLFVFNLHNKFYQILDDTITESTGNLAESFLGHQKLSDYLATPEQHRTVRCIKPLNSNIKSLFWKSVREMLQKLDELQSKGMSENDLRNFIDKGDFR